MPERFKVVFTMQGAIQVLGFTTARRNSALPVCQWATSASQPTCQ